MRKNYGTVQYNGDTYILLEDAYPDTVGPSMHPVYCSNAIRQGDEEDNFGFVPVYRVTFFVYDEYVEFNYDTLRFHLIDDVDIDEADLCDWDNPSDIRKIGERLWEEVK